MNRGVLLALLLIIAVVSVESGFGRSLRKRLKRIGKPFERAAKRVAEASAAGWIGKAAASIVGRRKSSFYGQFGELSLENDRLTNGLKTRERIGNLRESR
ncbi:hypothetical protein NECAME_00310 [Necator americanus]|uniref:Uncharacterized protein n=1 Tax=Necator americanus TaxID=51031 RepID=W2TAQ7_NECAM|nr:hypothetical protein NECAME_00310 [Necator americanus]ETN78938.1 hypothetical protein NECAME_00310 [Necator americanus]